MIKLSGELSRFRIRFIIEGVGEAEGELNRLKAPMTVEAILRVLPITSNASVWRGKEVYFPIGIKRGAEKAKKEIEVGEIAYWPMGDSLCIFHDKIKPYSEVNLVGRITRGLELFRQVKQGTRIRVELTE